MLTKTQLRIMELFVSKITEKFSIRKISEIAGAPNLVAGAGLPIESRGCKNCRQSEPWPQRAPHNA